MTTATNDRIKELVSVQTTKSYRNEEQKDDDWVVPGLLILRAESRNGRRYSQSARQDAARLCEGLALASEHEDETRIQNGNPGRLWHERLGVLEKGRLDRNGDVRADARLCESHPHARLFRDTCRKFPKNACLSVELDSDSYEANYGPDGIAEIQKINSMLDVSVVARGGTTRSLFESDQSRNKDKKMSESTNENEVVRIKEQLVDLRGELKLTKDENKVLKEKVKEFEAKERQQNKISSIKRQAATMNVEIDDDMATDLSGLSDERITENLKKWAARGSEEQSRKEPNHYAPTSSESGSNNKVDACDEWLAKLAS